MSPQTYSLTLSPIDFVEFKANNIPAMQWLIRIAGGFLSRANSVR